MPRQCGGIIAYDSVAVDTESSRHYARSKRDGWDRCSLRPSETDAAPQYTK